jgi:DNA-directed RNA polymerase beta subunit
MKAEDLPRTKDGITPDMIMNMHAIPSRMTIGQNIEQLFGKAAALSGALADGTAFMSDGSPEAAIGSILEQYGFEKYGNEIFYDGTTGVQMEMSLFMGPVFEMKLKHMVEDKWQARGQGRKEKITHQPTGGRGAQGGLKIGEMDRDAIIGHSLAAFQRESFMKRSDSSKIQICTGCGTVPIFNPSKKSKININQCNLCNGPPKYIGSTNHNIELLPLTKKQKGRIVTIELPYATNVLLQELASIANIGLRLVTTADMERLRPMETTEQLTLEKALEIATTPLVPINLPEPFQVERMEAVEEEAKEEQAEQEKQEKQ